MIVQGEHVDQKLVSQPIAPVHEPNMMMGSPPPYTAGSSTNPLPPIPYSLPPPPTTATRCNNLRIHRANSAIRGAYIVDPTMQVPPAMVPPLEEGQSEAERLNLDLLSKNASVNVDLWVVSASDVGLDGVKRVTIEVRSHNASATVKLNADLLAQPVAIKVVSHNASATLVIPPTFTGPLTIGSRNGGTTISDRIKGQLTAFSETKGVRSYFVGDLMKEGFRNSEWTGSSVHVESHNGRARVLLPEDAEEYNNSKNPFVRWFYGV